MNTETEVVRQAVADALAAIAPEAALERIDPRASLREQLDLDSFDFLNLLIALRERLGVEIAEADYGRVDSLERLVNELVGRMHGH